MSTKSAATTVAPEKAIRVSNKEIHAAKDKKAAQGKTPETDPKKSSKKKDKAEKALTEANVSKAEMKVEEAKEREVVYNYPPDAKSQLDKKAFRRKARAARKSYEKAIANLSTSQEKDAKAQLKAKQDEFENWKKSTYTKGDR